MLGRSDAPPIREGVTVDSRGARDLDDAFWVERVEDGFRMSVLVANVPALIDIGSDLDRMAAQRGLTVYENGQAPQGMLPPEVAHGMASLLPGVDRSCIIIHLDIDREGEMRGYSLEETTARSSAKFSYEDFDWLLDQQDGRPDSIMAANSLELASRLWRRRMTSLQVEPDWDAAFDVHGELKSGLRPGQIAQTVLQEIMVTANAVCTRLVREAGYPMIYRNSTARLGRPSGRYDIACLGHAGLGLRAYGQFTSAIRKFDNLVNLRVLRALMRGDDPPYDLTELALISVEANRANSRAENLERGAEKAKPRRRRSPMEAALQMNLPLNRYDAVSFRTLLTVAPDITMEMEAELLRRASEGLLTSEDVAWVLVGDGCALEDTTRGEILGMLMESPEHAQAVWAQALRHRWVLPLEMEVTEIEGGEWVAAGLSARHAADACADHPQLARDAVLCKLLQAWSELTPATGRAPLRMANPKAKTELEGLRRALGWEMPHYEVRNLCNRDRTLWSASLSMAIPGFTYRSPVFYATSRDQAELLAAEAALLSCRPLAEESIQRNSGAFGLDASPLLWEDTPAERSLQSFALLNSLALDQTVIAERPSLGLYRVRLTLEGLLHDPIVAEAQNPTEARRQAAAQAVEELRAHLLLTDDGPYQAPEFSMS